MFSKGKSLRTALFRSYWFKDKVLYFRFIILNSIEIILHLLRQLDCEVNITRNRLFFNEINILEELFDCVGDSKTYFWLYAPEIGYKLQK